MLLIHVKLVLFLEDILVTMLFWFKKSFELLNEKGEKYGFIALKPGLSTLVLVLHFTYTAHIGLLVLHIYASYIKAHMYIL